MKTDFEQTEGAQPHAHNVLPAEACSELGVAVSDGGRRIPLVARWIEAARRWFRTNGSRGNG